MFGHGCEPPTMQATRAGIHEGVSMKHEIAEEPATVRLRHILRPGTWSGLSLLEKIAVVQLVLGACTFVLLVVLVTG